MINLIPRKILAVDISDDSIEICEMTKSFGSEKITFLSRLELEGGVVSGGKITDRIKLANKIKESCGFMAKAKVAIALPDSIALYRIFKFADGKKEISKEDVALVAQKSLSIDLGRYCYDFSVQNIGNEKLVFFVAFPRKEIDEYIGVFTDIGFSPQIFDLNSLCALRSLDLGIEGTLVIDLGGRFGVLSVFDAGILQSMDIANFGGEYFTEKLSEKMSVPREMAELYKMTIGFDPDKEEGRIFLALQDILHPLIGEIRKSLNSYEEQSGKKIKKIILSGGSGLIPKMEEYIFENFSIKAEVGRPVFGNLVLDYLRKNNIEGEVDTIFFATTIGLAMKYFGIESHFNMGVNLLK